MRIKLGLLLLVTAATTAALQAQSNVQLTSSPNPSILGKPVVLAAALPSAATGKVTFYDGANMLGVSAISNGKAALTTSLLAPGPRALRAYYNGSTSAPLVQTVNPVPGDGFLNPALSVSVPGIPQSVATGDFNGDGIIDLAMANASGVSVLLGSGGGKYLNPLGYPTGASPAFVAIGDFDGDGNADLAVANNSSGNVSVLMGVGDGTFRKAVSYSVGNSPHYVAVGDFNGDGVADLVTANYSDNSLSVLIGKGDGTFKPQVIYSLGSPLSPGPVAIVVADFNRDGVPDLAVANSNDSTGYVNVLIGVGDGTFSPAKNFLSGVNAVSLVAGDFNGDRIPDLAVTSITQNFSGADSRGAVTLLLGNGDGSFRTNAVSTLCCPSAVAAGDFNGDGNLDLALDMGYLSVILGNGDGTFQTPVNYTAAGFPTFQGYLAVADLTGDGRSDVVVTDLTRNMFNILLGAPSQSGPNPSWSISPNVLPAGAVAASYTAQLTVTGGQEPYSNWMIASGTLPPGLTLSTATANTGTISGTPTANGLYNFSIALKDGLGSRGSPQAFSILVALPPVVTTKVISNGTVGATYTAQLAAASGTPPYTWTVTSGNLPAGLALGATTGVINGTPSAAGTYNFSVTAKDNVGNSSAPQGLTTVIGTVPVITTTSLPPGVAGTTYSAALTATAGTLPYKNWFVVSGALPPGLSFNATSGVISGTPTTATGSPFSVGFQLTDSVGVTSLTQTLSIAIAVPVLNPSPSSLAFNYRIGSGLPQAQSISLGSNGNGVPFTATPTGGAWLSATPSSGAAPATLSASVNPAGLTPGTYKATLTIASSIAANSPVSIPVSLTVAPAPVLNITPSTLTFAFQLGGPTPPAQSVSVGSDLDPLPYAVSATGGNWLSVTPAAGNTPGSVAVSVNPAGLSAGTYTGVITITVIGAANSPAPVPVSLVVAPPPALQVAPSSLTFSYQVGGPSTPPVQTLNIDSNGTSLPFVIAPAGTNWLTITPSQGSTPAPISVAASPVGLVPGTYTATITITSNVAVNSPIFVGVTLVVTAAPNLQISPTALSFAFQVGGAPPPAQTMNIASDSTALGFNIASAGVSWLSLAPVSGATPGTVLVSVNPAGLAIGTYNTSLSISAIGAGNSPVTIPVTFAVTSAPTLQATPRTLSFNYQTDSTAPPSQALTISSANANQVPFTVAVTGGSWLISGSNSGTTPTTINVFVNPIGLSPLGSPYSGTLTISSPNAAASVTVPVSLIVTAAAPPKLGVSLPLLTLSAIQSGIPASAQIEISNSGGGTLNYTVTATGGPWLNVSPASGSVLNSPSGGASTASITVSGDPSSLSPGTYHGSVTVSGAGSDVTAPVTLSVAPPAPVIVVSQNGINFITVAQGGASLAQQFGVLNVGANVLNWSAHASTLAGGNWLQVSTADAPPACCDASGTVLTPYNDISLVGIAIDPAIATGLAPDDYYGRVEISAPGAVNSPQIVSVKLTVLPPGSDPGPEIHPSGLIFTGIAGTVPASQDVTLGVSKAIGDTYISGQIASNTSYSYTPPTAQVQPNQPATITVAPDFTNLAPGAIGNGTITLQFSNGTPRTISILSVVAPAGTTAGGLALQDSSSCNNPNLNIQPRSLTAGFAAVIGQTTLIELQVMDSCGNATGTGGAVQATFSNKDPDLVLHHIGNGVWQGSWKPVNPAPAGVTIAITAFQSLSGSLKSGQANLRGTLTGNTSGRPLVTSAGVVQAASFVAGAPIAPGTLITLNGSNLADTDCSTSAGCLANTLPLPTVWNGAQVFLGSEPLPLLYAASGQVNVQIPYDVPLNTLFQVTVQRDNVPSVPEQLVIAEAQPGIFTTNQAGSGQGVIYRSDGSTVAQPGTPAIVGETISIYCTGLGTVNPDVPAGTPPPSSPLSTTINPVTVTIGGQDAPVSFSGLVPAQPGRYRVDAVVPTGVSGDTLDVVVTVAGQSSKAVTMAVQ